MSDVFDILVVDDDALFRGMLGEFLRGKNDAVREAPSGKDGMQTMRDKQAQIVFIDVTLPDMSGIDLMRNFAREFPKTYCVAITGSGDEKTMADAFLAGASDFVRKPFSLDVLEEVLQRCADRLKTRKNLYFGATNLHEGSLELKLPCRSDAIAPALTMIMQMISGFFSDRELRQFHLALDEALRNAYEHGNLGVTAKEKTAFYEAGIYEAELEKRAVVARADGKLTTVKAELTGGKFICTVTDQGKGFDWRSRPDPRSSPELLLQPRGRGLFIIDKFFDEVVYNEPGNQICLKKTLNKS